MSRTRLGSPPPAKMQYPEGATSWRCTFRYQGRSLTTPFYMGPALKDPPSTEDVLDCLLSDASFLTDFSGVEDFVESMGYGEDRRRGESTWLAVRKQTDRLRRFLGEEFDQWVYETERI